MKKIGLAFSGGGGKGPYQIGVWRAMQELGLADSINAVSGTSVGALNAVLFAQKDLKKAYFFSNRRPHSICYSRIVHWYNWS